MPGINIEGQVPVFVYPSSLTFSFDDESTHKQVLTIYNPYDFAVNYNILSNAPEKYSIPDSSGILKPCNRVDILVRHNHPTVRDVGTVYKLRVQITQKGKTKILGKKDIPAQLVERLPVGDTLQDKDTFEAISIRRRHETNSSPTEQEFGSINGISGDNVADSWFTVQIITIVLCLLALMMPIEGDKATTMVPPALHLSTSFKNVASFILGLVVMRLYVLPK